MGQTARDDRQQRERRHHPHIQFGLRPAGRDARRLLPRKTLRAEIDALNARIYETVNNGVYRCGFASTQGAYDEAVAALFATLDDLETRLADRRFLFGEAPTEADWRLFVTLLRFDPVYVGLFKCNIRRIADYPNLSRYRDTCAPGRGRRDRQPRPHQAPLLPKPALHQPDRNRAVGAGRLQMR